MGDDDCTRDSKPTLVVSQLIMTTFSVVIICLINCIRYKFVVFIKMSNCTND